MAKQVDNSQERTAQIRALKASEVRRTHLHLVTGVHKNNRGERLEFSDHYFMKRIYNDTSPVIAIQSSVQTGKTEYLVTYAMAALNEALSVFHILPKYDARNAFVADRIDPLIDSIPEYRRMLRGFEGKKLSDSKKLKHFGKGTWKFVGSNVPADYKDFPADVLICDEVDYYDMTLFPMAPDRLEASEFKFIRYSSNPTVEDYGINELFKKGLQFEWFLFCDNCDHFKPLDFFKAVVQDVRDHEGKIIDYVLRDGVEEHDAFVCPDCSSPLDRRNGKWVQCNPSGLFPSYHISKLMNLNVSPMSLFRQFIDARSNDTKLQRFYNSILGVPFTSEGSKVTLNLLKSVALLKSMPGSITKGYCTMGVDVGAVYDVRISWIKNGKRFLVHVGKYKDTDALVDLVKKYKVRTCVVDSLPETREVTRFQKAVPSFCTVWLCEFMGNEGRGVKGWTQDKKNNVVRIDRTFMLDSAVEDLREKNNILTVNVESLLGGMYVKEMTSIVRVLDSDARGNDFFRWTKGKDHQLFADGYDWLAGQLLGAPAAHGTPDDDGEGEQVLSRKASGPVGMGNRRKMLTQEDEVEEDGESVGILSSRRRGLFNRR